MIVDTMSLAEMQKEVERDTLGLWDRTCLSVSYQTQLSEIDLP